MRYLLTLFVVSLWATVCAAETVRNAQGQVIGYVEERGRQTVVLDCRYTQLGYANQFGTWDARGQRLSMSPQPYILLQESSCQKNDQHR